jgi:hypothetical protein
MGTKLETADTDKGTLKVPIDSSPTRRLRLAVVGHCQLHRFFASNDVSKQLPHSAAKLAETAQDAGWQPVSPNRAFPGDAQHRGLNFALAPSNAEPSAPAACTSVSFRRELRKELQQQNCSTSFRHCPIAQGLLDKRYRWASTTTLSHNAHRKTR